MISVQTNVAEAKRGLQRAQRDLVQKATPTALNRTARRVNTLMVRAISQEVRLKQSEIRGGIRVLKASSGKLVSTVEVYGSRRGRGFNLTRFVVGRAPKNRGAKTKGQVQFQVLRSGGRKHIKRAFLLNKPGNPMVKRVGKSRYPLESKTTIGLGGAFNMRRIRGKVEPQISAIFDKELRRLVDYYVGRFGR